MNEVADGIERVSVPPTRWHAWVLSDYYEEYARSTRKRTFIGDLVYRSKYLADLGALDRILDVVVDRVKVLEGFAEQIDGLGAVSAVAAVPSNPPKSLSLPHEVAAVTARTLGCADISSRIVKTLPTQPAKLNPAVNASVYEVTGHLGGERVLIVDDVFRTGATLESVARRIRDAGAEHVVGLCLTKAHKGMSS